MKENLTCEEPDEVRENIRTLVLLLVLQTDKVSILLLAPALTSSWKFGHIINMCRLSDKNEIKQKPI